MEQKAMVLKNLISKIKPNIANMKDTVKFLTEINPPRNFHNTGSLNKVANYIFDKFNSYGLNVERQYFDADNRTHQNIIASINETYDSRIIIGAHYDVFGNFPGADDNASAVAGLLEIARLLSLAKKHIKTRIDFIAYTLEEPIYFDTEYMGSFVHAKSLYESKAHVNAVINLEMIGYYSDKENSQGSISILGQDTFPSTGDFIAVVSDTKNKNLNSYVAKLMKFADINVVEAALPKGTPGLDLSDHRNYWHFNYPAIMITDTAFLRNSNYHTINDTIDTLNFNKMAEVVRGLCLAIYISKKI